MSKNLSILIYCSEPRLEAQLNRIIESTIDNPKIIKCQTYKDGLAAVENNEINILISYLSLCFDNLSWNNSDDIPEEIQLLQSAKLVKPNIFTIIVNTNLNPAIISSKISNFIDYKVIDRYISTTAEPYRQYIDLLRSELKRLNQLLKTPNKLSPSKPCESKNTVFYSYWIFIRDLDSDNHRDLIDHFLLWEKEFEEKKVPVQEASISVRKIDDKECSTLIDNKIINKNIELPILLVDKTSSMKSPIKIGSRTLTKLLSTNNLKKFIYSIHFQLHDTSICDIKKRIISQDYWNQFNIDDIIGFSPVSGEIILVDDLKTNSLKLELHHSIQYYDGKEEQIIEELKKENLEPERWEKMIDILALSDRDIAKEFLKDFLFHYSHDHWKPSLNFDLVSLQANKIIASLIEPDKLEEDREETILFLQKILTSGTEEAKLGCVRFITSFSDYLIDLRLFQPLLDLWGVYRNKKPKYVNLIKMALRYFIDSIEKREDTNSEYIVNFKPGIN